MRRFFFLMLVASGLLPASSRADVVTLESLEQRVVTTRHFEADEARLKGSEAEMRRTRSAYYPQISLNSDANVAPGRALVDVVERNGDPNDDDDVYVVSGARTVDDPDAWKPQFRVGVNLSAATQIYDFGRTKAAIRAGHANQKAVRASQAVSREALVRSLREAYIVWLASDGQARYAELARDDAAKRLARVRGLVLEGVRPRSDVAPIESELLMAELELARSHANRDDALLALEHVLGEPLPRGAEPDRSLLERELPAQDEALGASDRALSLQSQAAYAAARATQKERLPVLSGGLSLGLGIQSDSVFPSYLAGLKLAVPLWDGGLTSATSESARARGDELAARSHEQRREQAFSTERARRTVAQLTEQLTLARALHQQCQQRLQESEEGYEVGALGIEQVYQARTMLRRAESEVLLVLCDRARAMLSIKPIPVAQ